MRQAGTLPSKQDAERFADYLLTQGINSQVERAADQWVIWIVEEDNVARGKEELRQFLDQPNDVRYMAAGRSAKIARREAAERTRQAQKNFVDVPQRWSQGRLGPVTITLIAASVLAAALTEVGDNLEPVGSYLMFWMPAIEHGQVWRLITPIFLHAGVMHLVFNMWWLYDLGNLIERKLGWWRFAALVLTVALASNFGQYWVVGPNFLGMSGVVYGLFGYAWVRGRMDPWSGLYLRRDVGVWMMLWFFACLFGIVPHVANAAHGVGLAAGAALAFVQSVLRRRA